MLKFKIYLVLVNEIHSIFLSSHLIPNNINKSQGLLQIQSYYVQNFTDYSITYKTLNMNMKSKSNN